jgi:ParB/Sulfiredoxin domain
MTLFLRGERGLMNAGEARSVHLQGAGTPPQSGGEDTTVTQTLVVEQGPLVEQGPVVRVAIDSLVIADSPRLGGENPEHIQALATAHGTLPPIIVHRASMRVLDGIHRLRAAQSCGHTDIEVRFFDGGDADAFVVAVTSNITHGLPLSLADRKAAATRIIASHPQWSDRLIASLTGLAPGTIAETRRRTPDQHTPPADSRLGRDGRSRPTNTTERRTIASKLLTEDPTLSLRHVAKIAGLSPETVRDVRDHLHSPDPTPPAPSPRQQPNHPTHPTKPVHRAGRTAPRDLPQLMHQLRSDPILRGTETGRILLRLLDIHQISNETWTELCDNVPTHHKTTIATIALECAKTWTRFAEKLTQQNTHRTT